MRLKPGYHAGKTASDRSQRSEASATNAFTKSQDNKVFQGRKQAMKGFADNKQETLEPDSLTRRDVLDLVRAYQKITAPKLKKQLLEMAKAMASDEPASDR